MHAGHALPRLVFCAWQGQLRRNTQHVAFPLHACTSVWLSWQFTDRPRAITGKWRPGLQTPHAKSRWRRASPRAGNCGALLAISLVHLPPQRPRRTRSTPNSRCRSGARARTPFPAQLCKLQCSRQRSDTGCWSSGGPPLQRGGGRSPSARCPTRPPLRQPWLRPCWPWCWPASRGAPGKAPGRWVVSGRRRRWAHVRLTLSTRP